MGRRSRERPSPRLCHGPRSRGPGVVRPRWEPPPPPGGRAAVAWLLPATGNPLPQIMALTPWRQLGDEILLLGAAPDPDAPWAPLVDQAVPETGPAAGRLAWGGVVVSLPAGARWPDSLREMVLAGAEVAAWGFGNRWPGPAWLSALDGRTPTPARLADRVLFWRGAEAARVHELADLPHLGPPARLPIAVRAPRAG